MPRPVKRRHIRMRPPVEYFKPRGIPLRMMDESVFNMEEIEAIRLRDYEELQQEECAKRMNISRPTFHRVLKNARKKVADALINGKAIRIEGGNYRMMPPLRRRCGRF